MAKYLCLTADFLYHEWEDLSEERLQLVQFASREKSCLDVRACPDHDGTPSTHGPLPDPDAQVRSF